jgi:YegS/Rv2252/BmrU family lipid kinase
MKCAAIINPVSGRGLAAREWPRLLESLASGVRPQVTWVTEGPGHAVLLAAEARRRGCERIVVAGGDGTLNEVVNGLWFEPAGRLPIVGMVPFGTGCDYVRNFHTGSNPAEQLRTALGDSVVKVDVGSCRLKGLDGRPVERVFVMVLGGGFDALVVKRFRQQRLVRRGKSAYALSVIQELALLRPFRLVGEADGKPINTQSILFAAGLGRYFGGGMMIAPGASPLAGHFQLLWGESLSRWEILSLLPKIYLGKHVGHPQIRSLRARRVKLFSDPEVYVQAEGELIGRTPLELVVHPGSLPFAATAERKEAHPAKEYLQHFHASGAFHVKDLWHHNIIPATTSVPHQRPCRKNRKGSPGIEAFGGSFRRLLARCR